MASLRALLLSTALASLLAACDGGRSFERTPGVIIRHPDATTETRVDAGEEPEDRDGGTSNPDSGRFDCSQNPNRCVERELMSADCSCLGVCQSPWIWDSVARACTEPEPGHDAGFEEPRDSGVWPDAEPPDSGVWPDAEAPDSGVWPDAAPWDSGVHPDSGVWPDAGAWDGGVVNPGNTPLWGSCTRNTDCASAVCVNIDSSNGSRCTQTCGRSTHCPAGYTCWEKNGAKLCRPASSFSSGTYASAAGAACSAHNQCRSGYCRDASPRICIETCAEPADCGGTQCTYPTVGTYDAVAACFGPVGGGAHGASCSANSDCQSNLCVGSTCARLCASTPNCGASEICALIDASRCALEFAGICLQWEPNFTTACVPSGGSGNSPVGSFCSGWEPCRSGLCHTAINQCTDTCTTNAHCPPSHRCKVENYGSTQEGTAIFINICAPVGF